MYDAKNNLLLTIICFLTIILIMNWSFNILNSKCISNYDNKHGTGRKECFGTKFVYGFENNSNSMYLFACVDKHGGLNQYYIREGGKYWSDAVDYAEGRRTNKPSYVRSVARDASWSTSGSPYELAGIQCFDDKDTIFAEIIGNNFRNNKANCYGTSGENSTGAVVDLKASDIDAPNFTNNCTKENWYLYQYQSGQRDYIFAVFKRKPFTDTPTCCSNPTVQRNSCNTGYEEIKGGGCINYMKDYCNSGNNITNDHCKRWCDETDNAGSCNQYKNNYCNNSNNIKNSYDFCSNWCVGKDANCDTGLSRFCDENIDNNTLCGCFDKNALRAAPDTWKNNPTFTQNRAFCWNKECVTKGALTNTMKNNKDSCPKCFQAINLLGIEAASVNISDLSQSCNITNNNNSNNGSNNTSNDPPASIANINKNINNNLKPNTDLNQTAPVSIYAGLSPFQIIILKFVNNIKKIFNI